MRNLLKPAAAVALVLAGSLGATTAQGVLNERSRPMQAATPARDLGAGVTETKYVPITPCRVVDTRLGGGPIASGATRGFVVRGGAGFAAQGGHSGGCGVPTSAGSVEATITAVSAAGTGFLRAWPSTAAEPQATFLNFVSTFNPTNTGSIRLGCLVLCATTANLEVKVYGHSTQVVIDVQGYSMKPLAARVDSSGGTVRSSRVTSTAKLASAGEYQVVFDRDVSSCVYAVTVDAAFGSGVALANPRTGNSAAVFVQTLTNGGAAVDRGFYLTVTC